MPVPGRRGPAKPDVSKTSPTLTDVEANAGVVEEAPDSVSRETARDVQAADGDAEAQKTAKAAEALSSSND